VSLGWRHRDHTTGSLAGSLFVLSLPLVISGVLGGAVFQVFDLSFLSRLGEAPMAAVIITNQTVRQVSFLVAMGLSFAVQAGVARHVGAGDTRAAGHLAGQALALGLLLSVGIASLGLLAPEMLFSLPGPDPSFVPYGVPYVRLVFALNFGVIGTLLFAGILGGAGDTATPLLVQLVQFAVAIVAEWFLIFGQFGLPALGVRGVALGVATGQFTAMALGLTVLLRGGTRVHLKPGDLVPDPAAIGALARVAWLPAVQMLGGVVANFAFVNLLRGFGEHAQAAFAISLRVSMIVPMICFPLAGACATLVGQALGAGDVRRAWRAAGIGLVAHGAIMWSFAAGVLFFRHELVSLLSDDPEVVRLGVDFLLYSGGSFFFYGIYFVVMRSLQGAGDFAVPMALTLGNAFFVTIPLAWTLCQRPELGPIGVAVAQLVGAAVVTVATGGWFLTGRWARRGAHSAPR